MILYFPDLDTLRLALTTAAVPLAVSMQPAVASIDDNGGAWLRPATTLPRTSLTELRRLGVHAEAGDDRTLTDQFLCWPQLLPLGRVALVAPSAQQPVLFDMPADQLAGFVGEVLRLGNDRQSFHWLASDSSADPERAFLRVVGPPYYSLLRALDQDGPASAPLAHVEQAPGVWVQLGYTHPLVEQLKPPPGKLLLLRPPRTWLVHDDAPLRDIYEVLEFTLPAQRAALHAAGLGRRLTVPFRLARGGPPDAAELWVLRERPLEQLDALVSHADDHLLRQLSFAVAEHDGTPIIALRARPSRMPPPVLVLQGVGFRSYLRLPNLFLPADARLHPPLRRDAVRRLLADDPAVLTWLYPEESGRFTPQSLPDEAFRPLADWIDYVLDHDRQELQAWVASAQFDFESFVCAEDEASASRPPATEKRSAKPERPASERAQPSSKPSPARKASPSPPGEESGLVKFPSAEPSELEARLRTLEGQFVALEGGLDTAERQALWPQLATLAAALGHGEEAGLCWMNALWSADEPRPAWAWEWFRAEVASTPLLSDATFAAGSSWGSRLAVTPELERGECGAELDQLLQRAQPLRADLRTLAAYLSWSAQRQAPPPALTQRLGRIQQFLGAHEGLLPVRAAWLAWVSLVRHSAGDVLALARARDRLLERLFQEGLRPEQDLPAFLRAVGAGGSERLRTITRWFMGFREQAQRWLQRQPPPLSGEPQTAPYVDLIVAFGLARLGQRSASQELLRTAEQTIPAHDEAHAFLLQAYAYRIRQAQEGKPHRGPLPVEQMEYLNELRRGHEERRKAIKNPGVSPAYFIDRLRAHSRILEPDQHVAPYRHEMAGRNEFLQALAGLPDMIDRQRLLAEVRRLLQQLPTGMPPAKARASILAVALDQAPRVSEDFAQELLRLVLPTHQALPPPRGPQELADQALLLEKAVVVAAHFDATVQLTPLVQHLHTLLQSPRAAEWVGALAELTAECFRGLRKMGMRDELDSLLQLVARCCLGDHDLQALQPGSFRERSDALVALLQVAAGWYYLGRKKQADPVMDLARGLLFSGELDWKKQTPLACAYVGALGYMPVEEAQHRLGELLQKLEGVRDGYTTSTHYSRSQLEFVEAIVLTLVNEAFTLGTEVRRWLDDDEFLVRRRIHRDLRTLLAHADR